MPGIVGLITKMGRERAEPQLLRMVEALRHEHFYETGTWIDESLGVYVGWVSRDGSSPCAIPVLKDRAKATLIYSGAEFPFQSSVSNSNGAGNLSRMQGASARLWDLSPNFPVELNGRFHGLLIEPAKGTATLFNDRYGMHRIYYYEGAEAFYFAAESKAILSACPELRKPSQRGLGEFVAFSCVLEDRTIFQDIFALPAASTWTLRGAGVEKKATYFDPAEWENQERLDAGSYYEELRGTLSGSIDRYFAGPERVGVALTGGMDTRVIMASRTPAPGTVPCYTFGGILGECQDVRIARKVARACEQSHEVITVGEEFLKNFPHYAERSIYLTEGTVDVYRSADLYVSERARKIAPVKVVGTYGSEILRRAVMFKPMTPAEGLFAAEFTARIGEAGETYAKIRRAHPVTFAAFRQSPWYHHGILGLEETQLEVRSPFLDNDFVRTAYRSPPADDSDIRLRLISGGNPALGKIRSDRGLGGELGSVSSAILRSYLEFTFKAEYAYDYGMPQWLAQANHVASPLRLERLFLGRHKFLHYRVWYRDNLSNYVKEILLDDKTLSRPYIARKTLEAIVDGHTRGVRNYTTAIHKMLTLELLHRLFFDSSCNQSAHSAGWGAN